MDNPRFLRVAKDHVEDEKVAGLLASGLAVEMPDGNTPLPDEDD
jgi:hypothetical protein